MYFREKHHKAARIRCLAFCRFGNCASHNDDFSVEGTCVVRCLGLRVNLVRIIVLSVSNGQHIFTDTMRRGSDYNADLGRYLEPIRELQFVTALDWKLAPPGTGKCEIDAEITITTPRRKFRFAAEFKRTYMDRATLNMLIAQQAHVREKMKLPLMLIARYIPTPMAERLVEAGINFVDSVGNLHVNLGGDYYVFAVGRKEIKPKIAERRTTAAMVQAAFVFLVDANAVRWPVRKLAEFAGIGKTAAAEARQRLTGTGVLHPTRTGLQIANRKALEEDFVGGYERILRPELLVGRFLALEHDPYLLLQNLKQWAVQNEVLWALTGAAAAFQLQRFYRGEDVAVFIGTAPERLARDLKLLPDRNGTFTLLRKFGTLFPWRVEGGLPVAHPWLIYAELMHEGGPRAIEAATEIREKLLLP